MGVTVQIPPPLRTLTGGLDKVQAAGTTVAEVISHLNSEYPGVADRVYQGGNVLNRFVAIFVNRDIRLGKVPFSHNSWLDQDFALIYVS